MAKKIPEINASSMADISFLLLIFFLVTTSMDVNQGLSRRLPQPPDPNQKLEEKKIKDRDIFLVKINSENKLLVEGDFLDVRQLRAKAKEFIANVAEDPGLPVVYSENFGEPFGTVKYTKDHVISVQNDADTQYQAYLDVQNELVAAYNELREECAQKYFKCSYEELDEEWQKKIQKIYPQKISEAEPKNYGK
ncbi:MAG: biopolymer transporter ExbD [Paludibacteraceae bacterium]|jgi:biopolymer transport protein ExbD|nr:biopolymer transporter ExbD [Paludibacteraceae bacterium]